MRWDAYCYTPDPATLAAEFAEHGAPFSNPLKDTSDGLRGFKITDPDGYVVFFGRPRWVRIRPFAYDKGYRRMTHVLWRRLAGHDRRR